MAGPLVGGAMTVQRVQDPRETETDTLVAAMSSAPTTDRVTIIDRLIRRLKDYSLWSKLDTLWMLAAHDAQAALLNWKNPGTFDATTVNSPTFTVDGGYTGNGTDQLLDTNYNPSTAGGVFVQDSGTLLAWVVTTAQVDSGAIGTRTAVSSGHSGIAPRFTDDNYYGEINQTATITVANTNASGFWLQTRVAASSTIAYRNGSQFGSAANASQAPKNEEFSMLGDNAGFGAINLLCGGVGDAFTANQQGQMYKFITEYLQAVGAV